MASQNDLWSESESARDSIVSSKPNKHFPQPPHTKQTLDGSQLSPQDIFLLDRKKIIFTLLTLPEFNITTIARCLEVKERLCVMTLVHTRFNRLVLQPQCFPDMSFFPTDDRRVIHPKILSATGASGITYVEIGIHSQHPFVQKVGILSGMWNFRADLWNTLEWPAKLRIESLQLTLDNTTSASLNELHLDYPSTDKQKEFYSRHTYYLQSPLQRLQSPQRSLWTDETHSININISNSNNYNHTSESSSDNSANQFTLFSDTDESSNDSNDGNDSNDSNDSGNEINNDSCVSNLEQSIQHSLSIQPIIPTTNNSNQNLNPQIDNNNSNNDNNNDSNNDNDNDNDNLQLSTLFQSNQSLLNNSMAYRALLNSEINNNNSNNNDTNINNTNNNNTYINLPQLNTMIENNNNDNENENENDENTKISDITGKPYEFHYRIRNLFFIRFDHNNSSTPIIHFPKTLWGLGLQSFNSMTFTQTWWKNQLINEQRFQHIRFLVLSCCEFTNNNELQILIDSCKYIEHLSLRYVKWNGTIVFPETLVSLGWFPDSGCDNLYSLQKCKNIDMSNDENNDINDEEGGLTSDDDDDDDSDEHDINEDENESNDDNTLKFQNNLKTKGKLWQVHTRLNENCGASIKLLNDVRDMKCVKRIKFEYIRQHQPWLPDVELRSAKIWKKRDDLTVVIDNNDLESHPKLKEIFPLNKNQFIEKDQTDFRDCPNWSDEANDFISMTTKRKLLLR